MVNAANKYPNPDALGVLMPVCNHQLGPTLFTHHHSLPIFPSFHPWGCWPLLSHMITFIFVWTTPLHFIICPVREADDRGSRPTSSGSSCIAGTETFIFIWSGCHPRQTLPI